MCYGQVRQAQGIDGVREKREPLLVGLTRCDDDLGKGKKSLCDLYALSCVQSKAKEQASSGTKGAALESSTKKIYCNFQLIQLKGRDRYCEIAKENTCRLLKWYARASNAT